MEERRNYDHIFEQHFEKLNGRIDNLLEYNQRQDSATQKILKIIEGNGNPEAGMIVKQAKIQEQLRGIGKTLKLHWGLFVGMFTIIAGVVIRFIFI